MEWFDNYEIKARIAPTVIIILPLIVILFLIFQIPESLITVLTSLGIIFIVIYSLSPKLPKKLGT